MKIVQVVALFLFLISPSQAADLPRVIMTTTMGEMEIELFSDKAPLTVENFLKYVNSGFYKDLIFHRVIFDTLIQGGGYDKDLVEYETNPPVKNEAKNGLKNIRGTIAMARNWHPDSADSQFFINLQDNPSFDHKGESKRLYGYCVFGRVIKGMEIADAIGEVEKGEVEDFDINVPLVPILITDVKVLHD